MPLSSMNGWRITKYNPAFRDERGVYLKDEWTSVSDVGKSFDGVVLTFKEYREIEDNYVSTALSLTPLLKLSLIEFCKSNNDR